MVLHPSDFWDVMICNVNIVFGPFSCGIPLSIVFPFFLYTRVSKKAISFVECSLCEFYHLMVVVYHFQKLL